jgi:hypothetical protein
MITDKFNDPIFNNTSLSDLFGEIHGKINNKDYQIQEIIKQSVQIAKDNPSTAIALLPLITELLDVNVKNNDQLIKLATVIQRIITNQRVQNQDDSFDFSDEEIAQLKELNNDSNIQIDINKIKAVIEGNK